MSHIGRFWDEGGITCRSCGDKAGKSKEVYYEEILIQPLQLKYLYILWINEPKRKVKEWSGLIDLRIWFCIFRRGKQN